MSNFTVTFVVVFNIFLATQVFRGCCNRMQPHLGGDLDCGSKPCSDSKDCDSSGGCNVCAYGSTDSSGAIGNSPVKTCMSLLQSCGGTPPPQNDSDALQYLIIGDPITQHMFQQSDLKKKLQCMGVEAHLAPGAPRTSADGVRCIKVWVEPNTTRWDMISFNFGAWDAVIGGANSNYGSTYQVNLKEIAGYLNNNTMGTAGENATKLVFTLTTPTPNISSCCKASDAKGGMKLCPSLIDTYNMIATEAFSQSCDGPNVYVNDLWKWVNLHCCNEVNCSYVHCDIQPSHHSQCPIEFSPKGWDYLALNFIDFVKKNLNVKPCP